MPYHRCPGCGVTTYSASAYSTASVCPLCLAPLTDDSKLDISPPPGPALRRSLAAGLGAPRKARAAMDGLQLPADTRETVKLVVSEFVTNSVKHAGLSPDDQIELLLLTDDERVWIAVHDDGPGFSRTAQNGHAPGGFGFGIVEDRSEAWGVDCEGGGCTVWCTIRLDEASDPVGYRRGAERVPNPVLRVAL